MAEISSGAEQTPAPHASAAPRASGILVALIPWILFTIIADHGTLKLASIASIVIALGVCAYSSRGGKHPTMIEYAAVVTFIAFTIVALVADASLTNFLTRYARAIAAAVLSLLVFGSLLFVPFTEEYARQVVPREHWNSPKFKAINRRLTIMWGGIFAVMTCSHVIGGIIDRRATNVIFNWVIPIALILWGIKRSTPEQHDSAPVAPERA
jgi:Flp pilus assembly pilin Flp